MKRIKKQLGFTLLEMVIAISILSVIAAAVVLSYDGSKSRAQVLVSAMDEYGGAQQRLKADTSCYSKSLAALFNLSDASGAANSFCGADLSKQWNGPYAKPVAIDALAVKRLMLGQIAPELTLTINRVASTYVGSTVPTYKWYITAEGVPSEIFSQAMLACNGVDDVATAAAATATTRKCVETDNVGAVAVGSAGGLRIISLMFDETRQ